MKTKRLTRRRARRIVLSSLASLGLLMTASAAYSTSGYLSTWRNIYPASTSDNASCELCHGNSTQNINPYGYDMAECNGASGSITQRIQAIEGTDSDGQGDSNLTEINASTQPGWTTGAVPVWSRSSCNPAGTNTYPGSGDVDPAAAPEICDNGVDDNGNGLSRLRRSECDGFVGAATSCGVGACATTGNLVCQTPDEVDNCTPASRRAKGRSAMQAAVTASTTTATA